MIQLFEARKKQKVEDNELLEKYLFTLTISSTIYGNFPCKLYAQSFIFFERSKPIYS